MSGNERNQARAYMEAYGYPESKRDSAKVNAVKLMGKPAAANYIRNKLEKLGEKHDITTDRILNELAAEGIKVKRLIVASVE